MKNNTKLTPTLLKDYRAPDFAVEGVDLYFELEEDKVVVRSQLQITRKASRPVPLVLQGEELKLLDLRLDDQVLATSQYQITSTELIIAQVPDRFNLQVVCEIYPQKNTALKGLYRSNHLFCTQCEAQGFRRITYYLDRPDVMAPFTTTLIADKNRYPVLLSNGNKIAQGTMGNRHWVKWQDPFKKPCYLFALVAGQLVKISDTYRTMSGKEVPLEIYVEPENQDKCHHALNSLKKAMQWDEETYGREYDLDVYMIVAVNDFNMGAMENKGLNIFNSKYVLASEQTATDQDFQNIEAVIGHEYFHNWTGNRITCRDWFQLSLKEGLTVFREQQFSADMGSSSVKRLQEVALIRTRQFAEDAGPMSHPVRPESYIEINNFYTATIYDKGAEVIRMLHTLLGKENFRKGMDWYFTHHDGQAVTIEDFIASFEQANQIDLQQFRRWYFQAGTPQVEVSSHYDHKTEQFTLRFKQIIKDEHKPFFIPIKIAFYSVKGQLLTFSCPQITRKQQGDYLLLDQALLEFSFHAAEKPIPSLLGNFSAPIKLNFAYEQADLMSLMIYDKDPFNRWDCAQQLCVHALKSLMDDYLHNRAFTLDEGVLTGYAQLLQQKVNDPHFIAQLLTLPSFEYVAQTLHKIEVDALLGARKFLAQQLVIPLQDKFLALYQQASKTDDGTLNRLSIGYRALKNVCLAHLCNDTQYVALAEQQYRQARNMTDRMGALMAFNHTDHPMRQTLLEDFYTRWKEDPLVVNKWLTLQASSEIDDTLNQMQKLLKHPAFDWHNPNKVYALINTFGYNFSQFHQAHGRGYSFLATGVLELNQRNPQVAARLLGSLTPWRRFDEAHGFLMKEALMTIQAQELSEDVYEIVTKSLAE